MDRFLPRSLWTPLICLLQIVLFFPAIQVGAAVPVGMVFEPTEESLREHQVPDWFQDAKLGVLVHFGLYSVPGWGATVKDVQEEVAVSGWENWFRRHPASEYYLNSLRIPGSPASQHHQQKYGSGFEYAGFAPMLLKESANSAPSSLVSQLREAGVRYVVFTAKHHDGHLLWPGLWSSSVPPVKPTASERDFVSEWAVAVREAGMRFGVYYSSGLDWSFTTKPMTNAADLFVSTPPQTNYLTSVDRHWRDLIRRVRPEILWNDLGVPRDFQIEALLAEYYNSVPEGVVNDRFSLGLYPGSRKAHADFRTPTPAAADRQQGRVFEVMMPLGKSGGFKASEAESELSSLTSLVQTLVDVVARNGRLLLAVGPSTRFELAPPHQRRLRELGEWMKTHGEGIHGTRPWFVPAVQAPERVELRFTGRGTNLYVHCFPTPEARQFTLGPVRTMPDTKMQFLGSAEPAKWRTRGERIVVDLPPFKPGTPVQTLRITPQPLWLQPP